MQETGALPERLSRIGIQTYYIEQLTRSVSPIRDLHSLIRLVLLFRRIRPDIVHTHSSKTGLLGRIAARLARVPAVVHTAHRFSFPAANSKLSRAIYFLMEYIGGKSCDALIVLSESDRNISMNQLRIPAEKVHHIPNGVDVSIHSCSEEPATA